MVAIGSVTDITNPNALYEGQHMQIYATIENIGDTSDPIYFRMHDTGVETGVQSEVINPGESKTVNLWDYSNSEWFRYWPGPALMLPVWHGTPVEPDFHSLDDYRLIYINGISGAIIFKDAGIEGPSQAPEGTDILLIVRTRLGASVAGDNVVDLFIRMTDLDTGLELDYILLKAQINTSRQDWFTYTMPNRNFNVRCEIGAWVYSPTIDDFVEENRMFKNFSVMLGGADGRGGIRRETLSYPQKVFELNEFDIHLEWGNFGEVQDTIFVKMVNIDTGDTLYERRDVIQVNGGFFDDVTLIMPDTDLNIRIETGHDELGSDIIDDSEEFMILSMVPAYLNIDTFPVRGYIYIDGTWVGVAPVSLTVEAGTHMVVFGFVAGYAVPSQRMVTIGPYETANIVGEYVASGNAILALLVIGGIVALVMGV